MSMCRSPVQVVHGCTDRSGRYPDLTGNCLSCTILTTRSSHRVDGGFVGQSTSVDGRWLVWFGLCTPDRGMNGTKHRAVYWGPHSLTDEDSAIFLLLRADLPLDPCISLTTTTDRGSEGPHRPHGDIFLSHGVLGGQTRRRALSDTAILIELHTPSGTTDAGPRFLLGWTGSRRIGRPKQLESASSLAHSAPAKGDVSPCGRPAAQAADSGPEPGFGPETVPGKSGKRPKVAQVSGLSDGRAVVARTRNMSRVCRQTERSDSRAGRRRWRHANTLESVATFFDGGRCRSENRGRSVIRSSSLLKHGRRRLLRRSSSHGYRLPP